MYQMGLTFTQLWTYMVFFSLKIGDIPTDDGIGKEVITRLTANMATNKVFYTDSNGRDFLKRVIVMQLFTENTRKSLIFIIKFPWFASICLLGHMYQDFSVNSTNGSLNFLYCEISFTEKVHWFAFVKRKFSL